MIQFETLDREQLNEDEVRKISVLYERCFGKPAWPKFMNDVLSRPNPLCFFLSVDGERVGFRLGYDVGVFTWRSWLLGVLFEHRRRGFGAELIARGNGMLRQRQYGRVISSQTPEARRLCRGMGLVLRERASGEYSYTF